MQHNAAPGRKRLVRQLGVVKAHLETKRAEIDHYLRWASRQISSFQAKPNINPQTRIQYDMWLLRELINFINFRTALLRRHGVKLDDTWTLDVGEIVDDGLTGPHAPETASHMFKRACLYAESIMWNVMAELAKVEYKIVWNAINALFEDANGYLERETDERYITLLQSEHKLGMLREEMAEELNPDAVWLAEKHTEICELEAMLRKAGDKMARRPIKAAKMSKFMVRVLARHDREVLQLLETAEDMGIPIGGRQTLITEFFDRV